MVETERRKDVKNDRIWLRCDDAVRFMRRERHGVAGRTMLLCTVAERNGDRTALHVAELCMIVLMHGDHMTGVLEMPLHQHDLRRVGEDFAATVVLLIFRLGVTGEKSAEHGYTSLPLARSQQAHKAFVNITIWIKNIQEPRRAAIKASETCRRRPCLRDRAAFVLSHL